MKKNKLITILLTFFVLTQTNIYGQTNTEMQIRKLENQEKEAVLKGYTSFPFVFNLLNSCPINSLKWDITHKNLNKF